MENLKSCNFIKTVLMITVVIYHCTYFWTGSWFTACEPIDNSSILVYFSSWLKTFHVPAFTLTSGYIYYYIRFERKGYDSFVKFVETKCKRLLVPYIFTLFVWVIPFAIYFYNLDLTVLLKNYILGAHPAQLWFLLMLFGVFIIARTIDKRFRSSHILSIPIICILFVVGQFANKKGCNYFQIANAFSYLPYFGIGFKIRQHYSDMNNKLLLIVGLICFSLNIIGFICSFCLAGVIQKMIQFMNSITGALMAFLLLMLIARNVSWENKTFNFIQKSSFPVYLFHQQFIFIVIWTTNGKLDPSIIAIISFITSMAGALLITSIIRRYRILVPLIGEKVKK